MGILWWGIGCAKTTLDRKLITEGLEITTYEFTTVIGVPSYGLTWIMWKLGSKLMEVGL
jgi:hypothetical protein